MPAAPPLNPVPAPRGTTGTRWALASRMSSATSAVLVGRATASGSSVCRYGVSSRRYDSRSTASVSRRTSGRSRPTSSRNAAWAAVGFEAGSDPAVGATVARSLIGGVCQSRRVSPTASQAGAGRRVGRRPAPSASGGNPARGADARTGTPVENQRATRARRASHGIPNASASPGGSRPTAGHKVQSTRRPGTASMTAPIGPAIEAGSTAATGPRGGWRIASASARAVGVGWTGPSGASIAATYASKAAMSAGTRSAGTPNAIGDRPGLRVERSAARRRQWLDERVIGDHRRVDERGVDPQRQVGIARGVRDRAGRHDGRGVAHGPGDAPVQPAQSGDLGPRRRPRPVDDREVAPERAGQPSPRVGPEVAVLVDAFGDERMGDLEEQRARAADQDHRRLAAQPPRLRGRAVEAVDIPAVGIRRPASSRKPSAAYPMA